ncbi:MAG TPA: HlyD family efflux transporter periplasmic adaptor subunit [Acidobacteriota bacterium]|nr:HlyD family efflux transporter periplasmic adaptor subunit [Acidobacteriota bacterium]
MKTSHGQLRAIGLTVAILGIASLGIYGGRMAWVGTDRDLLPLTMEIRPREFSLTIPANGELQSEDSKAIAVPNVPVNRLRVASAVPEGRHVSKGDVLVEFDPAELDLDVLENRSNLEMANQKINKGELAVGAEKTDIAKDKRIAELELQKINEFLPKDEQIYSRREIIEGQLDKSYTEKKIVYADARLELKGKIYSLDEAILMLERGQAKAKIDQIEKGLASLRLLAPTSGIVVYGDSGFFWGGFTLMPGRVVWIGMTLFSLVNPEKMEAKCFVLEKDAGELRVGETADITLDPFPDAVFTGRIKNIDRLARPLDRDSPVKYFQTIMSLNKVDMQLMKPGVKVKARISAGLLRSVIVVPRSAVVKRDSGFIVFVQREPGRFEPVPVSLGQGDIIQVVVVSGLKPGQVIALNPPDVKQDFVQGTQKANKT